MPPTKVRMEDGKVISFPDGTPPDEMQTALAGYGKPEPTTEHNSVEEGNDWSLADAVQRGVGGFVDRAKGALDVFRPRSAYEMIPGVGQLATVNRMREGIAQNTIDRMRSTKKSWDEGDYIGAIFKAGSSNPSNPELYDQARKGDIAGAMGKGAFDAGALMVPELAEKGGNVATDVLASDAAKNFVEAPNLRRAVAGKVVDWARNRQAARAVAPPEPGMLPIGETPGVSVQGGGVEQPRVPSPAENMLNSLDAESAVRRAPNKGGRPPARVPSPAESIQSPLEPGTGTVAPRQFGDAPVSADASDIPTLADEMVGPLEQGEGTVAPRSMQPTADMTSGGGGANYSADDLANLISKHNIPPAPGEVVGGTPPPKTVRVFHGTDFNNVASIGREGIKAGDAGGPFASTDPEEAAMYAQPLWPKPPVYRPSIIEAQIPEGYINPDLTDDSGVNAHGDPIYNYELDGNRIDPDQITGVQHLRHHGVPETMDDAAILQAMREDLDAHGRNALHEESTDFAARNKVGKGKTGKPGYGFDRKLPEAQSAAPPEVIRQAERLGVDPDKLWREMQEHDNQVAEQEPRDRARNEFNKGPKGKKQ